MDPFLFFFPSADMLSLLVYLRRAKAAPDFMGLFSRRLQSFLGHVAVITLLDCRLGSTFPPELGQPDVGVCLVSCLRVDGSVGLGGGGDCCLLKLRGNSRKRIPLE